MGHPFDDETVARFRAAEPVFGEEDIDRRMTLADAALAKDPGNAFVKYAAWQLIDDEDAGDINESIEEVFCALGKKAIEDAEAFVAAGADGDDISLDIAQAIASMLADLAASRYFCGKKDEALRASQRFMAIDMDGEVLGRVVSCAVMVEKGMYDEIIDMVDSDVYETAFAAHCRAIALFETEGPSDESSDALLEAISIDPDMAFTSIGVIGSAEDDDLELEEDAYETAISISILEELWSENDDRLSFIGSVSFALAYITGRIDDEDTIAMIEKGYKDLGCLEEMQEARDVIHARIASGEDGETIDDEAIMAFRDLREKGCFK